jgi:hypothetical protein
MRPEAAGDALTLGQHIASTRADATDFSASSTAVLKPNDRSIMPISLSIVFGTEGKGDEELVK